jgi:hypothetical protein
VRPLATATLVLLLLAGGALGADDDGDGVDDTIDNCPAAFNPAQLDSDGDGLGNACDVCVSVSDAGQLDADDDGVGDACDACPDTSADVLQLDDSYALVVDLTGCSLTDRCPCAGPRGRTATWGRAGRYRACVRRFTRRLWRLELLDIEERRRLISLAGLSDCGRERGRTGDQDGDGILDDGNESGFPGDARCTAGVTTGCDDNCPGTRNPKQIDRDGDQLGDACDPDIDGDGFPNERDNCPHAADPTRLDTDDDGVGDVCDECPETRRGEDVDRRGCADGETPAG